MDRFLAGFAYYVAFALVWQLAAVFLRNDCYAVLANALRCHNLYRATGLTAKARLWRLSAAEVSELDGISAHDRGVARWFSGVYLAGMLVMGWVALTYALPTALAFGAWLVEQLRSRDPGQVVFWEALAVLALAAVQWGAPALLAVRERRLRRSGRLR